MSWRRQSRGRAADTRLSPAAMRRKLVILACAILVAPESGLASASRDSVRVPTDSVGVQGQPVYLADEVELVEQTNLRERAWPAFVPFVRLPDRIEEMTGALAPESSRLMGAPIIRGLDARRTSVTIDGIPVGHSGLRNGSAVVPLSAIDPISLSDFEIVRGPDVLDAGSNALGGAIRIRSLAGTASTGPARSRIPEVTLSQRFSSADRGWSGALSAAGEVGQLRYRAGGSGRLLGQLKRWRSRTR